MQPKIHILYKFVDGPWGGGNQFLKALREYFRRKGVYTENLEDADIILFNAYPFGSEQFFDMLFKIKIKHPDKILIHRVDGPVSRIRGKDRLVDEIIYMFNKFCVDGTIFQSGWCQNKNYDLGLGKNSFETVITNAPDPDIFYPQKNKKLEKEDKIKLIATCWAPNPMKGFDVYKFLDDNLDFNRYAMTFVGRSPIKFKRIQHVPPQPSGELAESLRRHDIFITASRNDPCSNALIESLHCGLPAVVRNDGGHPEIVGAAGELFEDERDILDAIEKVAQNYGYYQDRIKMPTMEDIGGRYYEFADRIYRDYLSGKYRPKQVNKTKLMKIKAKVIKWKVVNKIERGRELLRRKQL
jgi:glycosyltransferase involved in cell wall biosynthesis